MSRISGGASGLNGFTNIATSVALGANSRTNSSLFWPSGPDTRVMPVAFPPGRLKLATRPAATGSSPTTNTIGMDVVATLAAFAAGGPEATMTSTARRTNSVACAGRRSYWPSAKRYSITTLLPSTNPASFSPRRNAATRCAVWVCDTALRNPTTGVGCCARAASGQATAPPPITLMKSRRLMLPPKAQDKAR